VLNQFVVGKHWDPTIFSDLSPQPLRFGRRLADLQGLLSDFKRIEDDLGRRCLCGSGHTAGCVRNGDWSHIEKKSLGMNHGMYDIYYIYMIYIYIYYNIIYMIHDLYMIYI